MLPDTADHATFLQALGQELRGQGGIGLLFRATTVDTADRAGISARFQADRDEDYQEFAGQCRDFLAEIERETATQNFTFAEREENEHELQKLASWLAKIQARDFCSGPAAAQARTLALLADEPQEQ